MKRVNKNQPINSRCLLLNNHYQPLNLLSERKLIKLLFKGKVEVLSSWDNVELQWINNSNIKYPATVRLKEKVPQFNNLVPFNRYSLYARDKFTCLYCGIQFNKSQLTIDHVIPVSAGGQTIWTNCATCCITCNLYKGSKTLKEVNYELLYQPYRPTYIQVINYFSVWHPDWNFYLSK